MRSVQVAHSIAHWHRLGVHLFDQYPEASVLVDDRYRIERINRSARNAYGWSDEQIGQPLQAFVRLSVEGSSTASCLAKAEKVEELIQCDADVLTSSGHWVCSGAAVKRFGSELPVYLLQFRISTAQRTTLPPVSPVHSPWPESTDALRFDIDTSPARFGIITCADARGSGIGTWVGKHCYELLYGKTVRCERCPAVRLHAPGGLQLQAVHESLTDIIHWGDAYCVVRSVSIGPNMARVSERRFEGGVVRRLVAARLETLALAAGLSERERAVFELLVLGRSLGEIANILSISNRTVRFHQSNLLEKLGADSRLDLMRLLL